MEHPRYKIIERLDTGGMAEVFRAVAESTVGGMRRSVAIKRILPSLTRNKKFVAMFLDEARLSLYLQHTNIVQVTDIGKVDLQDGSGEEAYFLVMEYVDGVNVRALLEYQKRLGQKMPISYVLYLLIEVCKGLNYAHELVDPDTKEPLGIVHRDVSPPNILVSRRGEVKLVDFGLAKATLHLEGTDPGIVKGKFSYLAPEAAMGSVVDKRADVFAVGILLYEMLTNQRLFLGQTDYQTIELVRKAQIPPIRSQNSMVDAALETIIYKALARDPHERYASAADLGEAMAHYLFSNHLKVTSRDIENLVVRCLAEKEYAAQSQTGFLIDTLVQDEILKFISLEDLETDNAAGNNDKSTQNQLEGLIDPRLWNIELEPIFTKSAKPNPEGTTEAKISMPPPLPVVTASEITPHSKPLTPTHSWLGLLFSAILVISLIVLVWTLVKNPTN